LSVEALQAVEMLVSVLAVTRRLVGFVGGLKSAAALADVATSGEGGKDEQAGEGPPVRKD
jgi:hypothetical protein